MRENVQHEKDELLHNLKNKIRTEDIIIVQTGDGVFRHFPGKDTPFNRGRVRDACASVGNISRWLNDDVKAEDAAKI